MEKVGNPMVNHQILIGKGWISNGKPLDSYMKTLRNQMVNHQIPIYKGWQSHGKPSDSYIKR